MIVKETKREFVPAPEGLHSAVCVDVIDHFNVPTKFGPKDKVEIRWQINMIEEKSARPFLVIQRFGASLHKKASLRKFLEAWRGKRFTPEELEGFDTEKLMGVNCQLQILHVLSEDGSETYANIVAVIPENPKKPRLNSIDYIRVKDRDPTGPQGKAQENESQDVPF